jgi:hypothetical protein
MKSKLEIEIKKRLENREIKPTENAWQKIEFLLLEKEKSKNRNLKFFPIWIAASVLLMVGLFFLISENNSKKTYSTIVLNKEKVIKPAESQGVTNDNLAKIEIINKNQTEKTSTNFIRKINVEGKLNKISNLIIADTSQKKAINSVEKIIVVSNSKDNPPTKPIETSIAQKKTIEFVDADMLLFSVEHNHNLPKKEPSAKLVIIDFNK